MYSTFYRMCKGKACATCFLVPRGITAWTQSALFSEIMQISSDVLCASVPSVITTVTVHLILPLFFVKRSFNQRLSSVPLL